MSIVDFKITRQAQNLLFNNFDLANCYKLLTQEILLEFDFDFTSSVNELVMWNSGSSIKLLGGDWGDKGFVEGDSLTLSGIVIDQASGTSATLNNEAVTITSVQGDTLNFSPSLSQVAGASGYLMPQQGGSSPLTVKNTSRTRPEEIEFYHNLILNNSNHTIDSLLDGEVNRFVVDDTNSIAINDPQTLEQKGNKSGGRYVLDDSNLVYSGTNGDGNAIYKITLRFFLLPYEFADFERPTWFLSNQCLKSTVEIFAAPESNNPNSQLTGISFNNQGNNGWLNESYNQGDNPFSVDNFSIETSGGDSLSEVDHNKLNKISATITHPSLDFSDIIECTFEIIPPEVDFKNNEYSNLENSYSSYFSINAVTTVGVEKFVFSKNGGSVDNLNQAVNVVTANTIKINFDLDPSGDFANYINSLNDQDRRYRIVAVVQSVGGTVNDNNSVTLILKEGILTEAPIPDQPFDGVREQGFYNHVQDIDTGVSEVNYNGRTEDDMVFKSIFDLENNEQWERINLSVEVVKDSDGTSFDLFSRNFNITGNPNAPMIGGVIQLNFEEQLPQFLDSPERNKISIKNTGNTGATSYEVELIWSMMANWRYWLQNSSAFQEFYDNTLPNNGKTQEWVRYLETAGYSLRARIRLIKNDIAYYFGGNINILDYEDWDGVTTHTFFDTQGNQVTSIIQGQDLLMRADHVLNSGMWDINDMWGHIDFRPKEADPRKQISTFWDWTAQNLPLKPKQGETKATLEIVTTNATDDTARVECLIDGSLVSDLDNTPVSRIQSPAAPSCQHPIDYVFDYIEANIVSDSDIVPVYNQLLNQGNATGKNICCPTCDKLYNSVFGQTTLFAIGSIDIIDALIATSVEDPDAVCCVNKNKRTTPYPECSPTFNLDVTAVFSITGTSGIGDPSIINSYTGVNEMLKIKGRLEQLTTDQAIRRDLFAEIINRGLVMRCREAEGTIIKYLTRA